MIAEFPVECCVGTSEISVCSTPPPWKGLMGGLTDACVTVNRPYYGGYRPMDGSPVRDEPAPVCAR